MTITLHGDDVAVEQAAKQLYRLIDVLKVQDVTSEPTVGHELALVKIRATDSNRAEILQARRAVEGSRRRPRAGGRHRRGHRPGGRGRCVRRPRPDLRHQGAGPHRRRRHVEGSDRSRRRSSDDGSVRAPSTLVRLADQRAVGGSNRAGSWLPRHLVRLRTISGGLVVSLFRGLVRPLVRLADRESNASERSDCHFGGTTAVTARMYYDNDADPSALSGQTVAIIGYGSQGHAHALNLHESGVDVIVGLAPGSKSRPLAEEAGLRVADVADAVKAADAVMILVPDTGQKAVYDADIAPNLRPGQLAHVRPRLQHPFRADRPARRRRRRDGRAEGPRPPPPQRLPGRRRRAGAVRGPPRRLRHRPRARTLAYARALGSTRAGVLETTFAEETETDLFGEQSVLCGGDRVARQDGLRDARRGRLPAGARLLRDDARAEADRRPPLPRRPELHALQRQRHRRVRRLRQRAADHRRAGPRDDAGGPRRHPGRLLRGPLDRRERIRPPRVRATASRGPRPPDRAGRGGAAGPDGVPQPGRRPGGRGAGGGHGGEPARARSRERPAGSRPARSASSTRRCATASRRPAPD